MSANTFIGLLLLGAVIIGVIWGLAEKAYA